jgi:NAD(P)-dependent dehydrogenase (short-subunit alcohol dehydrogenase family)
MPTTFSISGKVIALTGGASGIGLQTAILLASQGAIVSIADLSEAPLKEVEAKITASGGTVLTAVVDVRDDKAVDAWIATTVAKFEQLDGAVNLAGVIPKSINVERVQDLNNEDWKFVLDVNLNGVMYCMRAQLKEMKDGGSVVNAASICGVMVSRKIRPIRLVNMRLLDCPELHVKRWGREVLELTALRRK